MTLRIPGGETCSSCGITFNFIEDEQVNYLPAYVCGSCAKSKYNKKNVERIRTRYLDDTYKEDSNFEFYFKVLAIILLFFFLFGCGATQPPRKAQFKCWQTDRGQECWRVGVMGVR